MSHLAGLGWPSRGVMLAIGLGIIGGMVFFGLGTPMPWMLGPLFACLVASLLQAPLESPLVLRPPMSAMIGVMMGAGYAPSLLGQLTSWWATILGMIVFMAVAGAFCVAYFRYVARLDFATAYFSGMPGGLVEMVLLGEKSGADMRIVALVHAARIVFTVFSIPFLVQWLEGGVIDRGAGSGISMFDTDLAAFAWLGVSLVGGLALGKYVRLPAPQLMGPLVVSVAIHMSGLSNFKAPWEFVLVAQLVLGTTIGCRFAGSRTMEILRILLVSLGSTLILIIFSILAAIAVSHLTQYSMTELLLAYAPGGLAEMGLLALALHLEVALISTHHILRIFLVVVGASTLMSLFGIAKPASKGSSRE